MWRTEAGSLGKVGRVIDDLSIANIITKLERGGSLSQCIIFLTARMKTNGFTILSRGNAEDVIVRTKIWNVAVVNHITSKTSFVLVSSTAICYCMMCLDSKHVPRSRQGKQMGGIVCVSIKLPGLWPPLKFVRVQFSVRLNTVFNGQLV